MTPSALRLPLVIVWLLVGLGALSAQAQTRGSIAGLSGDMSPGEVQQLFDAFELVRAQDMLDLSDDQYPEFVVGLKRLQDVRRRTQQDRQRQLRELQRMSNQADVDEAALEGRLESLRALERESSEALLEAVEGIDAILSIRQRVRFRVFQQAMERRRVELLMRARRQPARRQRDQPPPR